jgi:hypothetical protein
MGRRLERLALLRERASQLVRGDPEMTSTILADRLNIAKPTAERWVSEFRREKR